MNWSPFARAFGALVGVGALAVVLFVALVTALGAVRVPQWAATTAAAGAVVPAVLGLADAYTPLGSNARTELLQEKRPGSLAADLALTGAVGGVLGALGAFVLLGPEVGGLARTAVLGVAIAVGYGTFVARNYDIYRTDGPKTIVEDAEADT
jgi:membrane associated rhomboid family serine protease